MFDLNVVESAFSELSAITQLPVSSGQKYVFSAMFAGKRVAFKLIKRGIADLARTQREIDAVAKLRSKYVPAIVLSGTRTVGREEVLFIIEEFVQGKAYREILIQQPKQEISSAIRLLFALLRACKDFELNNIVHRDIKPENLIIDLKGNVWVIDFGLARHLDLESLTPDSPYAGVGTVGYAAPEQFQNIKAEINVRADLFAIGTVVYEALAGYNPFKQGLHTVQAVLRRMETETIPSLDLPNDDSGMLAKFVGTLIQRYPSRRPQSATEALAWLEPISKHFKLEN
jgi:eukaryotic-like serine/threonine-protein kinase